MDCKYFLYKVENEKPKQSTSGDRWLCFSSLRIDIKNKILKIYVPFDKIETKRIVVGGSYALEHDDGKSNSFSYFNLKNYDLDVDEKTKEGIFVFTVNWL